MIPKSTAADDKKIQMAVKKIGVNAIPGIEEVRQASLFTRWDSLGTVQKMFFTNNAY